MDMEARRTIRSETNTLRGSVKVRTSDKEDHRHMKMKFWPSGDTFRTHAGIHLERGFASMPRPPVKRHTIFCHAYPSPASLSTACAIVINKKLNNKTEKTRGLPCLTPISAPSVLFRICYESFI